MRGAIPASPFLEEVMKDELLWEISDSLSTMRLIIEGTVSLFENDAMPLTKLAHENQERMASEALDTIGEGLYSLRDIIRQLQEARIEEVQRQTEPAVIPDKDNI